MSCTQWNYVEGGFCENLIGGYPEYFNSITSIFISLLGLWGLLACKVKSDMLFNIHSGFVLTGIGSFLYHYVGYSFYGRLDTIPMLIVSWEIAYLAWEGMIEGCLYRYHPRLTRNILAFITLIFRAILVFFLSARSTTGHPWGIDISFTEAFIIPQVFTFLAVFVLCIETFRRDGTTFRYTLAGTCFLVFGAIVWGTTEPFCSKNGKLRNKFMAYTHGLWHLTFSYGAYLISLAVHIYANQTWGDCKSYFYKGKGRWSKALFTILPILHCKEGKVEKEQVQILQV